MPKIWNESLHRRHSPHIAAQRCKRCNGQSRCTICGVAVAVSRTSSIRQRRSGCFISCNTASWQCINEAINARWFVCYNCVVVPLSREHTLVPTNFRYQLKSRQRVRSIVYCHTTFRRYTAKPDATIPLHVPAERLWSSRQFDLHRMCWTSTCKRPSQRVYSPMGWRNYDLADSCK